MSENRSRREEMQARAEAIAKVIDKTLPQGFSSPKIMNPQGEVDEQGEIDELKLAVIDPGERMPIVYAHYRSTVDKSRAWELIEDIMIRSSDAVGGLARKQLIDAAIGMSGSGKNKMMQKKSWTQRHITQRGEPEYEEMGGEGT